VVLDNQIYLIGGNSYDPTQFHTTTFIYDTASKTWLAGGLLNVGRSFHGVALLNNKVYALGGATYGWTGIASVEEYDPVLKSWTSLANMPFATWAYGITTLDGKIYVVGGDNGSQRLNTVQVFRP
jgi:N-acetylneuraminic acid mutarotase